MKERVLKIRIFRTSSGKAYLFATLDTAAERRGDNFNVFLDFYLKVKAEIWP